MLRVLGRPKSINVRKVLWTLEELGAPFEHDPRWGEADHRPQAPDFLALNPNGLVPVIQDENGVLWESNTICRYLAAKHGRHDLLPADPAARAQVERWMDWQIAELNPVWGAAFLTLVRADTRYSPEAVARSAERWSARMRIAEGQLAATGAYIAGDAFRLADINIALAAYRYFATPLDHADLPATRAYLARLAGRPGFSKYAHPATP
jgi:glutathione S-transferase